jgi:hypothetical protein
MSHFGGKLELKEHPPLLHRQQQHLQDLAEDLDTGSVGSIKLQKDLNYPEQLPVEGNDEGDAKVEELEDQP